MYSLLVFHVDFIKKTKTFKLYGPVLWMGFNCLKATEPLQGDSVLLPLSALEKPGTHLIDLARMKG